MRKIKVLRGLQGYLLYICGQATNLMAMPVYQHIDLNHYKSLELNMHTLSINYAFNHEVQKADIPWLPTTLIVYAAVVTCALVLVATLDATGAGNAAELMGSAIALAAP